MSWARHAAILLAGALGVFANARAGDDTWIVANGLAYHFDRSHKYNWLTLGLGVEHGVSENVRVASGFYLNSHRGWSVYGGGVWLPLSAEALNGRLRAGVIAGGATGYRDFVTPVAGFALAYERKQYGLNLIAIPPAGDSQGVLWLQAKRKW